MVSHGQNKLLQFITPLSYNEPSIQETNEPSVIKTDSGYQIWFKDRKNDKNRIRYATSSDGSNWSVYPSPVLEGTDNTWDFDGPTNPYVLFENNQYHLWYLANNGYGGAWQIGHAVSPDGISWTKDANNPLSLPKLDFVGGMSVIKYQGQYHMWYQVGQNGINHAIYHVVSNELTGPWTCDSPCQILSRTPNSFDQDGMLNPDVLDINSNLYLWYGGYNGSSWQIGIATNILMPTSTPTPTPTTTPTPTPTPTPTFTPTPTPTPTALTPIIIIPGMFSSWNKQAILHNQTVNQSDWKMLSFIKEYDGLISTLKNLGYQENINYFVFNYDWRKNIESSANDLNTYINQITNNKYPITNINIIGHSLGGLIGRIWLQKYQSPNLNKLITIGTPHLGTAQVYKAVEAGDLEKSDSLFWLAQKVIITLNKNSLESDKKTINRIMPVLQNLLPIFPYLKYDYRYIDFNTLTTKNNLLPNYSNLTSYFPYIYSISGNSNNTLLGYNVIRQTKLDKLLNNYPDGRPDKSINVKGDGLITLQSSQLSSNFSFSLNHSQLIYKKESIKKILDILEIPYQDNIIVEGSPTVISPSLIFFLKSPAKLQVNNNNPIYSDDEGLIFIPNAVSGDYKIEVIGLDNGVYSLITGQIGLNTDEWSTVKRITKPNQVDSFSLKFNATQPKQAPFFKSTRMYKWHEIFMLFLRRFYK